jgi:hypothetical protein
LTVLCCHDDKERLRIFLEPPNQRDGQIRDLPYFGKRIFGESFSKRKFHSPASLAAASHKATPKPGSLDSI